MPNSVYINGCGASGAAAASAAMDDLIADALDSALADCGQPLEALEGIVACGNDADDGLLSPLLRAEAAGAVGRDYTYVTGSFCQAVTTAAALIASGLLPCVAVLAWGSGGAAADDNEQMIADPFFLRPVGATPNNMRALRARAIGDESWAEPDTDLREDAAVCLIMGAEGAGRSIQLADWKSTFRRYLPATGQLDPNAWMANLLPEAADDVVVAGDGPTRPVSRWMGGAVALHDCLGARARQPQSPFWFVESAGPLGQSMTALKLVTA